MQHLRRNKAFIVAETLAWVDRQTFNASPFSAVSLYCYDWSKRFKTFNRWCRI